MPDVKYKVRDFLDVRLISKITSVHRYLHRVAYGDQKPVNTSWFADANNILAHALQDHYCITLIQCPFEFNFESLLSHFGWFCQFMYFNFSETTLQFDVLKKLREKNLSSEELDLLLNILTENPEPYRFALNAYQDKAKFALMKRQNLKEKGEEAPFLARDRQFRLAFGETMKKIQAEQAVQIEQALLLDVGAASEPGPKLIPSETPPVKYEPSLYGYLRLNDNLTVEQQTAVIHFLYDLLKELFYNQCTLKKFEAVFLYEQSDAVILDLSKYTSNHLDAQKIHWIFRSLKDTNKILSASWEVIRKKIIVYNKQGLIVQSVYQISESKIPSQKKRQVEKLLQPLFDKLPGHRLR